MPQEIMLRNLQKPNKVKLFDDVEWLVESFGFSNGRDTNRITAQIFQNILREIAKKGNTCTETIADDLDLSIQRVNYHLKTLMDSGFLIREKRKILIRDGSVKAAIEEMRRDANRIFDNLSEMAIVIDNKLGFKNR